MPTYHNHYTLCDSVLTDAQLKVLKLPSLCYAQRRIHYEVPMSALDYLTIQQKDHLVDSLGSIAEALLDPYTPRKMLPSQNFNFKEAFVQSYGVPLPEQLLESAIQQVDSYYEILQKIKVGDKATCVRVGVDPECFYDNSQLEKALNDLSKTHHSLLELQKHSQSQGYFLAYPSHTLVAADQWLTGVKAYLDEVILEFNKTRLRNWNAYQRLQRQDIEANVVLANQRVKMLRKQLHYAVWMRLQTASNCKDPSLNAVYSHLRQTIGTKLNKAYTLTKSTLKALQPAETLILEKLAHWEVNAKADIDQATFVALHQIYQQSEFQSYFPLLNCYWLQADSTAIIPCESVQIASGWRVPNRLAAWVPHYPRRPTWFFRAHYFAYQLPRAYSFSFAMINGLGARLKESMNTLSENSLEDLSKHNTLQLLKQARTLIQHLVKRLESEQRYLLLRWVFRLTKDRRTQCIDELLKQCEEIKEKHLHAYHVDFVTQALNQFEKSNYAPSLRNQTHFRACLIELTNSPYQDSSLSRSLQLRWHNLIHSKPSMTDVIYPELSTVVPQIEVISQNDTPYSTSVTGITLETLMADDPDLEVAVKGLPKVREKTYLLQQQVDQFAAVCHTSIIPVPDICPISNRIRMTLMEANAVMSKAENPLFVAINQLAKGYLLEPRKGQREYGVDLVGLLAFCQTASTNKNEKCLGTKQNLLAGAKVLFSQLRKGLRLLPNTHMPLDELTDHGQWLMQVSQVMTYIENGVPQEQRSYQVEKLLYRYLMLMKEQANVVSLTEEQQCEANIVTLLIDTLGTQEHRDLWHSISRIWLSHDVTVITRICTNVGDVLQRLLHRRRFMKHCNVFLHYAEQEAAVSQEIRERCISYLQNQQRQAKQANTVNEWSQLFKQTQDALHQNPLGERILKVCESVHKHPLFSVKTITPA